MLRKKSCLTSNSAAAMPFFGHAFRLSRTRSLLGSAKLWYPLAEFRRVGRFLNARMQQETTPLRAIVDEGGTGSRERSADRDRAVLCD
jgi:hypothetical protein